MSSLPLRCNSHLMVLSIAVALATMVGCQGFSAGKSGSPGAPTDPDSGELTVAPGSVTFGNVQLGTSQNQSATLSNTGGSSLTVTQSTVTGAGFSVTGLTVPLTLAVGQSVNVSIVFAPQAAGSASGSVVLANDGSSSPLNIALSGVGVAAGDLSASPTSLSFGNVQIGSGQTLNEQLTNTGGESLTISQASSSSPSFSFPGLSLPLVLAPNQSATFGVVFTPSAAGASNGILSITESTSSAVLSVALSGTGTAEATPATLTATPPSVTFTGGQVGSTQTQTVTLQNTGGESATISQDSVAGTGFSISGLSTPLTLVPGGTASVTVTFAPQASGTVTGSVAISSNASNANLTISLNGSATGVPQGQLSVSPGTINFGSVTVGTSGTASGTLSATGASVVVSSVDVGGSEFVVSGISFPATIAAGQSLGFTVTFTPQSSGVASVSASFYSTASNSPASATLTGTGVAAPVHTVVLNWNASGSPDVIGYNVYRRTGTTGSYSQINSVLDAATTYTDTSVADGQTYYYETTAVNSSNEESARSTALLVTIPAP